MYKPLFMLTNGLVWVEGGNGSSMSVL